MELILIRHGDAYAGLHGTIAGPIGCRGLTDRGRAQAESLRQYLASVRPIDADVLLASSLPRAIETATIIAPALGFENVVQDCDLCEVHTGEADGMDWTEHAQKYGPINMIVEPDRFFAPGGDSWNSFHQRVRSALDRLAAKHQNQVVVAVCHAGVIAASVTELLGRTDNPARLVPDNTGLTRWDHHPETGQWTLRYYNDTAHLTADPTQLQSP